MWITRVSINNPVFATMVMVGITVLGVFSYDAPARRADARRQPAVRVVQTQYPGAAPEAVETDVTKPIEYAVNQVSGVKRRSARTRARARAQVFVEFRLSTDMTQRDAGRARQDRAGAAGVPERRQGPAGRPRRQREPAAGRLARRDVADDRACASSRRSPTRRSSRRSRTCPASRASTSTAA